MRNEYEKSSINGVLVAVGAALYLIIPGYGEGMKPDFMLTMMFIGILLFPETKKCIFTCCTTGVISGFSQVSLVVSSPILLINLSLRLWFTPLLSRLKNLLVT